MSLRVYACSEPITEPDILESIRTLPTEDDLSYDDGEPMGTARHGIVVPTPLERAQQERQRAEPAVQQAEQARQRTTQAEQLLAAYQRRFGHLDDPS
jgi:hypothetical protein